MGAAGSNSIWPITITGVPGQTNTNWGFQFDQNIKGSQFSSTLVPNQTITAGCQPITGSYDPSTKNLTVASSCNGQNVSDTVPCTVDYNSVGPYLSCPNTNIIFYNFASAMAKAAGAKDYAQTLPVTPVTPAMVNYSNYNLIIWFILIIVIVCIIVAIYNNGKKYKNK